MTTTKRSEDQSTEAGLDLAVLLPNGIKDRIDPKIVQRETLRAGMWTPFTRLPIVPWREADPARMSSMP